MFFFPKQNEQKSEHNPPKLNELYRPTNSSLLDGKNPLEQSNHLQRQVTSYNFNTNNKIFDRPNPSNNTQKLPNINQRNNNPQQMPVQQMPAQQMPAQQMPVQQMPAQQMPVQQMPPQQMPAQQMPAQQMPPQQMPSQQMPGQQMPVQQMPAQQMPVQQMPAQQMPAQQMNQSMLQNYNPYDILGIHDKSNPNEIKQAYRKLASKHHPDKGGNPELFDLINKAFQTVLRRAESIKPKEKIEHNDLKKGSESFFKKKTNVDIKKSFNIDKFNTVYEENKMKNPYEKGYSDWKEDIVNENVNISNNINSGNFNSAFEESRKMNNYNKQIQTYEEPQALASGQLNFTEIGMDDINTFTKNEGDGNNINFTDYKDAYTIDSKLIDPNSIDINQRPDNINKMEQERSNISYEMNQEQKRQQEIRQKQAELQEHERLQRVNLFDEMATEQYNKVNQKMLGNS